MLNMEEKKKLKVVFAIDHLISRLKIRETVGLYNYPDSKKKLLDMRKKYIFKDISQDEYDKDVDFLKKFKKVVA